MYICLLESRCLIGIQYELVLGAFYVVCGQVNLLLRVLMSKMLILEVSTVLVPGVFVPRLAVPGVLEVLMLSKAWKYTHNHLESLN